MGRYDNVGRHRVQFMVSLPPDLRAAMREYKICWSHVARAAFADAMRRASKFDGQRADAPQGE